MNLTKLFTDIAKWTQKPSTTADKKAGRGFYASACGDLVGVALDNCSILYVPADRFIFDLEKAFVSHHMRDGSALQFLEHKGTTLSYATDVVRFPELRRLERTNSVITSGNESFAVFSGVDGPVYINVRYLKYLDAAPCETAVFQDTGISHPVFKPVFIFENGLIAEVVMPAKLD